MPMPERETLKAPSKHELDPIAFKIEASCQDCGMERTFVLASDLWRSGLWTFTCRKVGHRLGRLRVVGPA